MSDINTREQFRNEIDALPKFKPSKLMLLIGWSLAMASIDTTIVNQANPSISKEPNFIQNGIIPTSTVQWNNDIYSIAFASFAIPAAKIGDRFGQTLVHRIGVFGFIIFSALCGCSKYIKSSMTPWEYGGFYVLIASRLLQGICAAFNMANSMSLSGILVKQEDVAKSMAMNSLVFGVATAVGPVLGGILVQYAGWQFAFFINIPIGIISVIVCWIYLPKTPKLVESKTDIIGAIQVLVGLATIVLGFTYLPPDHNNQILGGCALAGGVLLLVAFAFWELKCPYAILPKQLLTNKKIMMTLFAALFNFAMIVCVSFQQPFALQTMRCIKPVYTGLISLVVPVSQIVGAGLSQFCSKRFASMGVKVVDTIFIIMFTLLLGAYIQANLAVVIVLTFLFTLFFGAFFTTNNSFMMQTATPDIRGILGGCIQAFRETGFAIGIALINLVHDLYIDANWKGAQPEDSNCATQDFLDYAKIYFQGYFLTDGIMAVVGLLAMLFACLAGFNDYERGLKCYCKKGYNKIYQPDEVEKIIDAVE